MMLLYSMYYSRAQFNSSPAAQGNIHTFVYVTAMFIYGIFTAFQVYSIVAK